MTFKLGLTGSIGMGKSTTANLFAEQGCAVWDADAAVHRMYAAGGSAVKPIGDIWPEAIQNGAVSRDHLKRLISKDSSVLETLESIVHPLVAVDREEFLAASDSDIVVFDIPLLFEGSGHKEMDAIVCVSVSPEVQQERVLARGTMSRDQFLQIRERQMPNEEKRARSDFVVVTDTLDHAREQVIQILDQIRRKLADA